MADIWMDVDTALSEVPVNLLPLVDDTDFKTREESVAYNATGLELIWHFTTPGGATTATVVTPTTAGDYDWAHQDGGLYTIEIPASGGASINNDTEGFGWFTGVATGILPWRGPVIGFRASGLNDALIESAWSATRGLAGTALPAAAADAAGGLPISDAGGLDLDALNTNVSAILADTGTDGVVVAAASKSGYSLTATTGLGNQTANITGNLSGSVGSVTGAVGSVTAGVTVTTNNDKTGYALSSAGVQAIWDALSSALTTAGSIGKRLVDYLTGDIYARIGAPAGASVSADVAAIKSETAAILDDTGTSGVVVAAGSKTGYSLTATTGLGNQTANITGNLSGSVGSVTGNVGGIAGTINTLDALDTAQDSQHSTTQSAVAALNDLSSADVTAAVPTVAQISDGVWDEAKAGHVAAGSFGEEVQAHALSSEVSALNDLSAAEVNAEVDTAITDAALATAANLATVDTVVDAIKVVTDALGSTAAAKLALSAAGIVGGSAVTGTLSTTAMTTNLTEATDDHYNGRIIVWTSGALAGQATDITDYTGATKLLTYTGVTEAPSNGDTFVIV